MGLDMYAYKVKKGLIKEQVDFTLPESVEEGDVSRVHYWRKHPNLHGWMEELYREKGGKSDDFNCDNVQLTEDYLIKLERDIKSKDLPETSGFFFGESSDDDNVDDLNFITEAKQAIDEGYDVYYTSWW